MWGVGRLTRLVVKQGGGFLPPPCPRYGSVKKKCGPNGGCTLDKGVPWTRGGGGDINPRCQQGDAYCQDSACPMGVRKALISSSRNSAASFSHCSSVTVSPSRLLAAVVPRAPSSKAWTLTFGRAFFDMNSYELTKNSAKKHLIHFQKGCLYTYIYLYVYIYIYIYIYIYCNLLCRVLYKICSNCFFF